MSIANEILRLQTAKADIKTAIENKGVMVGDGTIDTYAEKINEISGGEGDYEQGYNDGYAKAESENPFYYATTLYNALSGIVFPENYEVVIKVKKAPTSSAYTLHQASGFRSTKWISEDNTNLIEFNHSHRNTLYNSILERVDLTEYNTHFTTIREAFRGQTKLKSILGVFDVSHCETVNSLTNAFMECNSLEDVEFASGTIKVNISFSACEKLTAKSIQSIIDGLATVETAQTLTLHANLKILQSQVDSANAKGWTVAGGTVVSEEEYYG
jgi:hypothetical protein